jgi:hypothetical protein
MVEDDEIVRYFLQCIRDVKTLQTQQTYHGYTGEKKHIYYLTLRVATKN